MKSVIKDILLENKAVLSRDNTRIIVDEEEYPCRLICQDGKQEYLFLGIKDTEEATFDYYYGVFKVDRYGVISEVEREGHNRESLNMMSDNLNNELFDARIFSDDKIVVLAIKFLINNVWNTIIYELDSVKGGTFKNIPSDFIL